MERSEEEEEEARSAYPGSAYGPDKWPPPAAAPEPAGDAWDLHPKTFRMGGVEKEFFLLGDLARALHRAPVTVRKWEQTGVLPKALYRTPAQVKERGARRLYTREMVEGVVKIAWEEGLMDKIPPPNIGATKFKERVQALFMELKQ